MTPPPAPRLRSAWLAAVLLVSAGAQIAPPADTTGMIVTGEALTMDDLQTGKTNTLRYSVYPDSTVGLSSPGTDTTYYDPWMLIGLGQYLQEELTDVELEQPIWDFDIIGGDVQVYLARAIPVPLAIVLLVVLPLGTVALVVFLTRRLVQERRQRRELERVGRQLAQSRESERVRIARDLHDGPLQDLHALGMRIGMAAEGVDPPHARMLQGTREDMHTVVGELRGITEALRPPALGPFGLAAALRSHADRFRRNHLGIRVELDLDDDGLTVPEETRLVLFRIAQEAMTNAAKHARAERVTVRLRLEPAAVYLSVQDDGAGFTAPPDVQALASQGHFGFLGMQERAASVGGTLGVENAPGGGASVSVSVPLARSGTPPSGPAPAGTAQEDRPTAASTLEPSSYSG